MDLHPMVKNPIPIASHRLKDKTLLLIDSLTEKASNVQPLTTPLVYTCNTLSSLTASHVTLPSALSNTTQEPICSQAIWDLGGNEINEGAYELDPSSADKARNLCFFGS